MKHGFCDEQGPQVNEANTLSIYPANGLHNFNEYKNKKVIANRTAGTI